MPSKTAHVGNGLGLGVGVGVLYVLVEGAHPALVVGVGVPILVGSVLPDVDTEFGRHRKTCHNVFVLTGLAVFPVVFANLAWVWLGAASHVLLDLLCSRRGVALLYPLSAREFGIPGSIEDSSGTATATLTALQVAVAAVVLTAPVA